MARTKDKDIKLTCPFNKAINVLATLYGGTAVEPCSSNPDNCKKCGWNPLVRYKRDTYGVWDYDDVRGVKFLNIGGIDIND